MSKFNETMSGRCGIELNNLGASRATDSRRADPTGIQSQDFAFNLSTKRRLCNKVGRRIGRAKACAAYRCAVTAARSLAATSNNLARVSRTLVLRALFGGPKSCALVNLFMICPRGGE
jgi:hypothetical protein